MIGVTVGSYCVTQKLSVGGMGTVYKAEHVLIGKLAAVKVLHPELCHNRDIVNRFFNEAKATTQIKHPGIVEVFDFGYLPSGDAFIVMEFLEGMSLAQRLETRGKLEEGEAAMLLKSVCSALGAAHAKKIVHRDLKPDNIFLVPDPEAATGERPKLLDFGIAKLNEIGLAGSNTKTGAVMGTPTYMSPEQCRGTGNIDLRADLYSLGCIYYELVCGRPPFEAEGAGELIGAHLLVTPDSPRVYLPAISVDTEKLIMALLAKNPEHRPQTAKELSQRLTDIARQQGWITNTSPTGVTTESLRDLPEVERAIARTPSSGTPSPLDQLVRGPTLPSHPGFGAGPDAGSPLSSPSVAISAETVTPKRTISPTTLSGAASAILDVPRSSRGKWIAVLGAVTIVGAIVGFLAVRRGDSKDAAKQPSTAVPATASATPVPVAEPAPPPVAVPTPVPAPGAPPTPTTSAQTSPVPKRPNPIAKTPRVDKLKKPAPTKPDARKPDKGKGSGSGHILIETDL